MAAGNSCDCEAELQWKACIKGCPRMAGHAAVAVGQTIYSFGGSYGEKFWLIHPVEVHVLTIDTNTSPSNSSDPSDSSRLEPPCMEWKLLPIKCKTSIFRTSSPSWPLQRYGHTVVAYGHNIYLWGGRTVSRKVCNILYRFDTRTLKWEKPFVSGRIPPARDGHSAVVIQKNMYIFGGCDNAGRFSDCIHALNLETLTWAFIPTTGLLPTWRRYHTAVVYRDRYMFIFGGKEHHRNGRLYTLAEDMGSNSLVIFDVETQQWFRPRTTGVPPESRHSHSAFMHNGFMYIFGGYNGASNTLFNDLIRYDPEKHLWEQVSSGGQPPSPRYSLGCAVFEDSKQVFIFGGLGPLKKDGSGPIKWKGLIFASNKLDDTCVLDLGITLQN